MHAGEGTQGASEDGSAEDEELEELQHRRDLVCCGGGSQPVFGPIQSRAGADVWRQNSLAPFQAKGGFA